MTDEKQVDLGALTAADFQPLTGSSFTVTYADYQDELKLVSVTEGRASMPSKSRRNAFSLIFQGSDTEHMLSQRIHPLLHAQMGKLEIFLVPMGQNPDGSFEYQACFN